MIAVLELELVGDNVVQMCRMWTRITDDLAPGLGKATFGSCPPSAWVAEITGRDSKWKYARKFCKFNKDYSRTNSKGSRGVYAIYILEDGKLYEVKNRKRRYFAQVIDGYVREIDQEDAETWLNDNDKDHVT